MYTRKENNFNLLLLHKCKVKFNPIKITKNYNKISLKISPEII